MSQHHAPLMIRDAAAADEADWRRLWGMYNAFYENAVSAPVTDATWRRILDPSSSIFARVAVRDTAIIGFAIFVLHDCTWTTQPVCYLEDLFVDATARRSGAGRALIEDGMTIVRDRGFARLYWHTKSDNAVARRLYDTFTEADGFVRYTLLAG